MAAAGTPPALKLSPLLRLVLPPVPLLVVLVLALALLLLPLLHLMALPQAACLVPRRLLSMAAVRTRALVSVAAAHLYYRCRRRCRRPSRRTRVAPPCRTRTALVCRLSRL